MTYADYAGEDSVRAHQLMGTETIIDQTTGDYLMIEHMEKQPHRIVVRGDGWERTYAARDIVTVKS